MNADAVRDCLEIIGNGTVIRGEQVLYRLAEALHLLVTTVRLLNREHETHEGEKTR